MTRVEQRGPVAFTFMGIAVAVILLITLWEYFVLEDDARLFRQPNKCAVAPLSGVEDCAHRERAHLFWRITNPAPRTVCSKSCAKPLSTFDRKREMCTSMTLVCGSK